MKALKYLFFVLILTPFFAFADGHNHASETTSDANSEKYNPQPMIMEHIADAHEFHIVGHLSVPLPVILKGENGIHIFMSSAFHHDQHGVEVVESKGERFVRHENKVYTANANADAHGSYITFEDGKVANPRPLDVSLTKNVFAMLLAGILLCVVFIGMARFYKRSPNTAPKGIYSLVEPIVVFVRDDIAKAGIGHGYEKFLPYIMTVFFFILFNNLLGLIPIFPGSANVTGNIAVTLVLAAIAGLIINVSANKYYWKHIFMPPVPVFLWPILIPVELLGVFTKPISLMIRLFANISAGHIIVLSLVSLIFVFGKAGESMGGSAVGAVIAVPFTLFISVIELMVAFIQAFIFSTLTATFIGMAIEEHH